MLSCLWWLRGFQKNHCTVQFLGSRLHSLVFLMVIQKCEVILMTVDYSKYRYYLLWIQKTK